MVHKQEYKHFRSAVKWLLFVITFLYVITGFGITEYRTVETLTFGVLDKATSFEIHTSLEIPFLLLLALHVLLIPLRKVYNRLNNREGVITDNEPGTG